jgi:prepilin-type N-terminal cleavage/methylation domain-containing protein
MRISRTIVPFAKRWRSRTAFTLIELLTVIAIIAVLGAIAVGTYFRVRNSLEESATEVTLAKLQSQFEAQSRAVMDNVQDDRRNNRIPAAVLSLAEGDNVRAGVIWGKIRMKQEFPQNFWEAVVWPQLMQGWGYPVESRYVADLKFPSGTTPRDPATMSPAEQYLESAVLLYMSLTKGRRGVTGFNPTEHIGANAVGKVVVTMTTSGVQREFDVFLDSWRQPIGFIRWPFGGASSDLNRPPQLQTNAQGQPIDPQDPERTLQSPNWSAALRNTFMNQVGHPLNLPPAPPLNLSAVIMSAGRDQQLGVRFMTGPAPAGLLGYFQDDGTGAADDNVYGYRVKVGRSNN